MFIFNCSSAVGRPKIALSIEDVEAIEILLDTCCLSLISRSTLNRRLDKEELPRSLTFTEISDQELDRVIGDIKSIHPNDGERLIIGHLVEQNIRVPRARVRAAIHRVDPINTEKCYY